MSSAFYRTHRIKYDYVSGEHGKIIRRAAKLAGATVQGVPVRGVIGRQDLTISFPDAWNMSPQFERIATFEREIAAISDKLMRGSFPLA